MKLKRSFTVCLNVLLLLSFLATISFFILPVNAFSTLLTFNSKYVITSTTAVYTTSSTLVDDTQASKTFTLSASQTVLAIYAANHVHQEPSPITGLQNAISVDSSDVAKSWDTGYDANFSARNTVFWVGILGSGSHTIIGRFASNTNGANCTISNRVLLIYILNGDEFGYIDSTTTATRGSTTFANDPPANLTLTPTANCTALILYNIANSPGTTETYTGKRAAININGTAYALAEKAAYTTNYADSVFTVHALGLNTSTWVFQGSFATQGITTCTISRRQFAVLFFDNSTTLLDTVTSTTRVTSTSNSLVNDTQAKITRTTSDTRELLVVAMGTKRKSTSSSQYGQRYGIQINTVDLVDSRGGEPSTTDAESESTAYAEQLAAGAQTIQGRFSNNYAANTAAVDARQVVALWLTVSAGDTAKPTYSSPATNTTLRAMPCNFSVTLMDETALGGYIFGTNNTGAWANDSLVAISGTSYNANTTKTLNATGTNVVQWEYWFNDSSNNLNNTGIQSLTITVYVEYDNFTSTSSFSTGTQSSYEFAEVLSSVLSCTSSLTSNYEFMLAYSSGSSFTSSGVSNYEFFGAFSGSESFSSLLESGYDFGLFFTASSTSGSSLASSYELSGVLSSILSSASAIDNNYEFALVFSSGSSFSSSNVTGYAFQAILISSTNLASLQLSNYDLSLVALSPSVAASVLQSNSEFTLLFSSYSSLSSSTTSGYALSGVLSSILVSTSSLSGNNEFFLAFPSGSSFASSNSTSYEFMLVFPSGSSFTSTNMTGYGFASMLFSSVLSSTSLLTENYEFFLAFPSGSSFASSNSTSYEFFLAFPSGSSSSSSSTPGYSFSTILSSILSSTSSLNMNYAFMLVLPSGSSSASSSTTGYELSSILSSILSSTSSSTTSYSLSAVLSSILSSASSLTGSYAFFLVFPSGSSSASSSTTAYELSAVLSSLLSSSSSNTTGYGLSGVLSGILASSSSISENYEFMLVFPSGSFFASSNMTDYGLASMLFSSVLSSTSLLAENYELFLAFPSGSTSVSSNTSSYEFFLAFPSTSSLASSNTTGYGLSGVLSSILTSTSSLNANYEFFLIFPSSSSLLSSNTTGYSLSGVLSSILNSTSSLSGNYEFFLVFPSGSSYSSSNTTSAGFSIMLFSSVLSSSSSLTANYEFFLIFPSSSTMNSLNSTNNSLGAILSSLLNSSSSSTLGYDLSILGGSNLASSSLLQSNGEYGTLFSSIMQAVSLGISGKETMVNLGGISTFSSTLDAPLKVIVFSILGNGSLMVNWVYVSNGEAWVYNTGETYNLAAFPVINQTVFTNYLFNNITSSVSYPYNPFAFLPNSTGTVVANFVPLHIGPSPPPPIGGTPVGAPVVTLDVNVLSATFMQAFWNPQPTVDVFIVNKGIPSGDVVFNYTVTNAYTTNVVASGTQTTYITSNQGKTLTIQLPSLPAGHYFVTVSAVSPAQATGNGDLIVTSPFYGQLLFWVLVIIILIVLIIFGLRRRRS